MDMDQIVRELDEAAQYEGTETGEGWGALCHVWRFASYISEQFQDAVEKELREQHKWMTENFTWVGIQSTVCEKCGHHTYATKELVWNEELPYHE
jgi:hypothetical protein